MIPPNADYLVNDQLATLRRIEELMRAVARATLSEALTEILADRDLRLLYERAGKIPTKELSRKTRFSARKISGLWKKWEAKGLMVKDGKSYRPIL